nr:MAG TPA: hypothetical protein [Caudoviricetes sp.]
MCRTCYGGTNLFRCPGRFRAPRRERDRKGINMEMIKYYAKEVVKNKDGHKYWEASNSQLAGYVYDEVKQSVPEAKYYNFEGLQIITTNDKQEHSLLSTLEVMEDLCNERIIQIHRLRDQIYGGATDV